MCSSMVRNYECPKLNNFLVTIFLSEWGYCVYIQIPLRLSPAPTFRALRKYERSDVTFSKKLDQKATNFRKLVRGIISKIKTTTEKHC